MAVSDNVVFAPEWLSQASRLKRQFTEAEPFPHLVLDGFLTRDLAESLLAEFPDVEAMPRSRDYVFGNKRELSSVEEAGPAGAAFHEAILSDAFQRFLLEATGYDVFVDPAFFGGGFHQGGDGSFLDMHVDFNVHPAHPDWLRTLNVLIYLNRGWKEEYGGQLLLRSAPSGPTVAVAPLFNRCVVMLTGDRTYHGYRKMSLPPGVTRKSIAAYAYRLVGEEEVRARTTGWAPEGASPMKRFLARHYDRAVRTKNRFLGSGTSRNR
ncbi:MAG TPA: 2OG-Fe(II) oxygenase [Acidimicrobiia bacterium]|nr:2OG-Fe(II) oxygenase [Acidimicrobiia bacterium]